MEVKIFQLKLDVFRNSVECWIAVSITERNIEAGEEGIWHHANNQLLYILV